MCSDKATRAAMTDVLDLIERRTGPLSPEDRNEIISALARLTFAAAMELGGAVYDDDDDDDDEGDDAEDPPPLVPPIGEPRELPRELYATLGLKVPA